MTHEQRNDFPATALIDTRVKILDVARAGDELLKDLIDMGRIGDDPNVVADSSGVRHLVWRGYLTGGLITVWLRLGHALRSAEVSAFIADPRLEVFVPADGDIAVFGALRHAVTLSWEEWDDKVKTADTVEDLVACFVHAAMNESPMFEPPTRGAMPATDDDDQEAFPEAERVREHPLYAPRPEMIEQLAPGDIDWELVDESEANLSIACDPEGNVVDESVRYYVTRWRTDVAAPGTILVEEPWDQSFAWAAAQWQWVGEEGQENDDTEQSEWVLRGNEPLTVSTTLEHLPPVLHGWVLDSTRRAISDLRELAHEGPAFRAALDKLRRELAEVERRNEPA